MGFIPWASRILAFGCAFSQNAAFIPKAILMSIQIAEKLKSQLTDKYVVVKSGVPELRRFNSLTGVVKTVNMNGRALVEFDGAVDIGWYDIDPQYLVVVEAPAKKAVPLKEAESAKPAAAGAPTRSQAAAPAAPA